MTLTGSLHIFLKFLLLLTLPHTYFAEAEHNVVTKENWFSIHISKRNSQFHGLQISQVLIQATFLHGISHRIIIKYLWKVYTSFFIWEELNSPFLYGCCCVLENRCFWIENFFYFICLQLCNTTCNWCHNPSLYIWQNLILACWAVSKRSLEFGSKDVKWGVIQPLETCYALLFLFHDHSELTTVVYFSLGTDNFFISLGSHMEYRCCCIHANFCQQFPVNFSVFSRDLKHG